MNTLFIDTSSNQEIKIGLAIDKKTYWMRRSIGRERAQVVLPMIDALLQKHNVALHTINSIKVHTGPGSFTGLRVGISVANALAWTLKIPVNGKNRVVPHSYT